MRFSVILLIISTLLGLTYGMPVDELLEEVNADDTPLPPAVVVAIDHLRQKRATCDLIGSQSLCALHCIARGNRGGYCNSQAVCVCRN
jgi:hypothetical protein